MLEKLERLATEVAALHSKLILLVGAPRTGKTALLVAFGKRAKTEPMKQRHLQTTTILRELADQHAPGDLLLLDNIELLFDRSLQLDPLDLLKRHAHARRVVAVWPGELQGDARTGRLTYADMGHPEHQDYSLAGVVPFEIQ
jgi:chloramphenicol 3-O-phosphotransferase